MINKYKHDWESDRWWTTDDGIIHIFSGAHTHTLIDKEKHMHGVRLENCFIENLEIHIWLDFVVVSILKPFKINS